MLGDVSNTVVEHNVAYLNGSKGGNGGVGIWAFSSDNVTIQYNESYDNKSTRGMDGDGFDFDADVSNSVGPAVTIPQPSRGAAFGDLDNDGRIDVVVENIDGSPMVLHNMILHNEGTGSNHWITIQLVGTRSNRLGLGAKVRVVAGSLSEIDEVRSGGSYLSQNDLRVHFGLGSADRVDRVEVRWPSGGTQVLQNLAPDRFYIVKEGEGIVTPDKVR